MPIDFDEWVCIAHALVEVDPQSLSHLAAACRMTRDAARVALANCNLGDLEPEMRQRDFLNEMGLTRKEGREEPFRSLFRDRIYFGAKRYFLKVNALLPAFVRCLGGYNELKPRLENVIVKKRTHERLCAKRAALRHKRWANIDIWIRNCHPFGERIRCYNDWIMSLKARGILLDRMYRQTGIRHFVGNSNLLSRTTMDEKLKETMITFENSACRAVAEVERRRLENNP